jgi:Xaa-Pro aminopeptidase
MQDLKLDDGQAVLIIAASDVEASLYYACRFLTSDPVAYVEIDGESFLLLNELELGRGRLQASTDHVLSLLPYEQKLREGGQTPNLVDMLMVFFEERGITSLLVPAAFPIAYGDKLRAKGLRVDFREEPFYSSRAIKNAKEIEAIAASQAATVEAMDIAIDILKRSRISGDFLELSGKQLTSEDVRMEIQRLLLDRGYLCKQTIVAGGDQGCDPHVRGEGPLPANLPIVIDIFPQSMESRYWGDMTRTVLRGTPTKALENLHGDVLESQEQALASLKDGAEGQTVHQTVVEFFKSRGRVTEERDGRMEGFFHSTGHGLGLDIHEYPKIGRVKSRLQSGHVVTVEPGLYYFGLGGVRIEDLVVVTDDGHRNLTDYAKEFVV